MIQIDAVGETLPVELDQLRADARAEGFRFVDRLVAEWASGANRFSETGEVLLVARVDEALAGIGGVTLEPAILGALRMRRFYIRPPYRRMGIGRRIVERLLVEPSRSGTTITVNAGTDIAPAFWEALGFGRDERDGYTHVLRATSASPDLGSSLVVVAPESPDQPDVLAFLKQADERSASLYPAESRHGLTVTALLAADVRFFVARQAGRALGCGGYVLLSAGSAEMKRLFVDPAARSKGIGGRLVQAIESAAGKEGVDTLLLETGIKSNEALRLYKRLGFTQCGPFASYRPDPLSVFMVKSAIIGRTNR